MVRLLPLGIRRPYRTFVLVLLLIVAGCDGVDTVVGSGSSKDIDGLELSGAELACLPDPCSGHGFCTDGDCDCDQGYAGEHCNKCEAGFIGYPDCTDDPCEPDPCDGHGFCSEGVCDCDEGYAGSHCNQCGEGWTGYPDCHSRICVPNCDGIECGLDGCGGSCGTCPTGVQCVAGICAEECQLDEECEAPGSVCVDGVCQLDPDRYFVAGSVSSARSQ